jgi:hypothetical protein
VLCPDLALQSVSNKHCLLLNDSLVEKSEYVTDFDKQQGYWKILSVVFKSLFERVLKEEKWL